MTPPPGVPAERDRSAHQSEQRKTIGATAPHFVCRTDELPPGERKIVSANGRSIGVFNVGGRYYALRNLCPHRAAPLCLGRVRGLVVSDGPYSVRLERDGEFIACPWHGWEFDLTTGQSHFNPHRLRVRTYDVTVAPPPPSEPASPACAAPGGDEDPSVERYDVSVENGIVLLHVPV